MQRSGNEKNKMVCDLDSPPRLSVLNHNSWVKITVVPKPPIALFNRRLALTRKIEEFFEELVVYCSSSLGLERGKLSTLVILVIH